MDNPFELDDEILRRMDENAESWHRASEED
jgi:predicted transcriptional regulator